MPVFKGEGRKGRMGDLCPAESDASYARLLPDDDADWADDGARLARSVSPAPKRPHSHALLARLVVLNAALLAASLGCLGASLAVVYARTLRRGDEGILRQTTFSSPVVDSLAARWGPRAFTTQPLAANASVFRQDPSAAVDAAWDRVADLGVLPLTRAQVVRLAKDPAAVLRAPPAWGLGDDAYLGQLDGVHLLHCLNAMRKSLHHNYARYYPRGHSAAYRAHLAHCQEALAQWLMCQPSVELVTFNWVERHEAPFPDFDITRQCRDFDQLLAWQDEHRVQSVNDAAWKALRLPPGVVPKPSPLLNEETLNHTWVDVDACAAEGSRLRA